MRRAPFLLALSLAAAWCAAPRAAAQVRPILSFDAPIARVAPSGACALASSAGAPALLGLNAAPAAPALAAESAAPSAALAALAPAIASPLFASAAVPAQDAPVFPRLIDPSAAPHPEFARQLAAARGAVREAFSALSESVARGGWNGPATTLEDSCCGDAAPKLAVLLRGRGLPARLVEAEFHYYVLLDLPGGQVVIDPTVRQFFRKAPAAVPTVFVGTLGELHGLFARNGLAKSTRYDPSRIYFSAARDRESRLAALDREVRSGSAGEHAPLRRFLSAPRPTDPAPGSVLVH